MNLVSSRLLLREANMVVDEESMILDAGSVSTASRFKINSLENSFAPKYKSGGAVLKPIVNVLIMHHLQCSK